MVTVLIPGRPPPLFFSTLKMDRSRSSLYAIFPYLLGVEGVKCSFCLATFYLFEEKVRLVDGDRVIGTVSNRLAGALDEFGGEK